MLLLLFPNLKWQDTRVLFIGRRLVRRAHLNQFRLDSNTEHSLDWTVAYKYRLRYLLRPRDARRAYNAGVNLGWSLAWFVKSTILSWDAPHAAPASLDEYYF